MNFVVSDGTNIVGCRFRWGRRQCNTPLRGSRRGGTSRTTSASAPGGGEGGAVTVRVRRVAAAAAAAGGGATVDVPYPASVGRLTRPRLNPFRSPVSARGSDNALPTYSNAFVFGWGVDL